MRVLVTADPEIPVPPRLYGGIERIIALLVQGLVERGHDITLLAHADSRVPCRLDPYPATRSRGAGNVLRNMGHVSSRALTGGYDLVHSFGRLAYLLPLLPLRTPKVMSYQRHITPRNVRWGHALAGRTLHFVGCSRQLIRPVARGDTWHVVYNGVPTQQYGFVSKVADDAPLVFLGRIERIKGAHVALEVARRTGRRLVLAGNVPEDPEHRLYFEREILPRLDRERLCYVGPVADSEKNELLGRAAALLMPVLWAEPFGIVMAEALACGTPVIGLRRGAVPEIVENGVSGFVCDTVEDMVGAVERLREIDRSSCRSIAEKRFSDKAVVDQYEALYFRVLNGRRTRSTSAQATVRR